MGIFECGLECSEPHYRTTRVVCWSWMSILLFEEICVRFYFTFWEFGKDLTYFCSIFFSIFVRPLWPYFLFLLLSSLLLSLLSLFLRIIPPRYFTRDWFELYLFPPGFLFINTPIIYAIWSKLAKFGAKLAVFCTSVDISLVFLLKMTKFSDWHHWSFANRWAWFAKFVGIFFLPFSSLYPSWGSSEILKLSPPRTHKS